MPPVRSDFQCLLNSSDQLTLIYTVLLLNLQQTKLIGCCFQLNNIHKHLMKKIYLLIIGIIMFSCNQGTSTGSEKKQTGEQNLAAVKTIQLNVSGMTCEGCENTVESALTKVDGVVTAEASYVKSVASVSYDTTKVKRELLTETINNLGYHVEN